MGVWLFLILFFGIALMIIGIKNKDVSKATKIVICCFLFGSIFILIALVLFLPGSSVILDQLFQVN